MTPHLFLVAPGGLADAGEGAVVRVDGPEGRHAVSVLRVRPGETVYVGDGAGIRALARVETADADGLRVRVLGVETTPAPEPSFVLVQALAKGDRDEQAIETATELGVDAVVPWQAARSVVQWRADRAERGIRRWEALTTAAAKQSRRTRRPRVEPLAGTSEVCRLLADATLGLVLHEAAELPLAAVELPSQGAVVLVVGPEGGIAPEELAAFASAGATTVRLGAEVLRASSAGPAALAVLNARTRWR